MTKTILYRWFKAGSVPKKFLPVIEREGIVLLEEGIACLIHFKKFRAPGKYYGNKLTWGSGAIVLTKEHLLAFRYSESVIGLSWQEVESNKIEYYIDSNSRFCVSYDASQFNNKWSGQITIKFAAEHPHEMISIIKSQLRQIRLN